MAADAAADIAQLAAEDDASALELPLDAQLDDDRSPPGSAGNEGVTGGSATRPEDVLVGGAHRDEEDDTDEHERGPLSPLSMLHKSSSAASVAGLLGTVTSSANVLSGGTRSSQTATGEVAGRFPRAESAPASLSAADAEERAAQRIISNRLSARTVAATVARAYVGGPLAMLRLPSALRMAAIEEARNSAAEAGTPVNGAGSSQTVTGAANGDVPLQPPAPVVAPDAGAGALPTREALPASGMEVALQAYVQEWKAHCVEPGQSLLVPGRIYHVTRVAVTPSPVAAATPGTPTAAASAGTAAGGGTPTAASRRAAGAGSGASSRGRGSGAGGFTPTPALAIGGDQGAKLPPRATGAASGMSSPLPGGSPSTGAASSPSAPPSRDAVSAVVRSQAARLAAADARAAVLPATPGAAPLVLAGRATDNAEARQFYTGTAYRIHIVRPRRFATLRVTPRFFDDHDRYFLLDALVAVEARLAHAANAAARPSMTASTGGGGTSSGAPRACQ